MPTPRADSYTVASGGSVWAGRPNMAPTWASAIPVGQWAVVPLAVSWADVDPEADAAVNPAYPGTAPWHGSVGHSSHVAAWCGGATDGNGRWCNVIGQGHSDGGDNAAYEVDLRSEAPAFRRLHAPSGALPGAIVINDGQEASGLHADGRARAGHGYSTVMWHAAAGQWVWASQRGSYISGAGGGGFPVLVHPATGEHTCRTDIPTPVNGVSRYAACYDPRRARYCMKATGSTPVYAVDLTQTTPAAAWIAVGGPLNISAYTVLAYVPGVTAGDDVLLLWSADTGWRVLSIDTGVWTAITMTGTAAWDATKIGYAQPVWCDSLGGLLAWNNATDTAKITRITPGANRLVDPWVLDTLPVDGGNTITPAAAQANGTYGRFFLWPAVGCAFLLQGMGASDLLAYRYQA